MRHPRLNAVRMFDAAARHLNFRVAAEELNLTQGAVAQAVRGLEADLGVVLFRRLARGLALTEMGEVYHSKISRGLALIDEAASGLQPPSNTISVSVPPSFASKWLVPKLPNFAEAYSELEVRIVATEAVTNFASQDVDIAIRQGGRPNDGNSKASLLAPIDLCAFCSPVAKFSTRRTASLKRLAHLPLIQDSHRHWERLLPNDSGVSQFLQFNQTALALDAAANGQGVAIAPVLVGARDVELGRLVEIWRDKSPDEDGFWLVQPRTVTSNVMARRAFTEWLKKELGQVC